MRGRAVWSWLCAAIIFTSAFAADILVPCTVSPCSFDVVATAINGATGDNRFILADATFTGCSTQANITGGTVVVTANVRATIDCLSAGRPFAVSGITTSATFSNIDVFRALGYNGGAMYINGTRATSVVLDNTRFMYNQAYLGGTWSVGGAIYSFGWPTITITNSAFLYNSALHGGGIFVDGQVYTGSGYNYALSIDAVCGRCAVVTMNNVTGWNNYASTPSVGQAGFLFMQLARLNATAVDVRNNVAEGPGGAISMGYMGAASFYKSTFTSNTASPNYANGAAGGVFVLVSQQSNSNTGIVLNIYDSLMSLNRMHPNGIGGVVFGASVTVNMYNCTSLGNGGSNAYGGTALNPGDILFDGGRFAGQSSFANPSDSGWHATSMTLRNLVIENSVCTGSCFTTDSGPIVMTNVTMRGNSGGVVIAGSGSTTISGCTFQNNLGGAFSVSGITAGSMLNNTFTGNSATEGSCLKFSGTPTWTVSGNTFTSNTAGTAGAGVQLASAGGVVRLLNNTFSNNKASVRGGAIDVSGSVAQNFTAQVFIGNSAPNGGDVAVQSTVITLAAGSSRGAQASSGGFVYLGVGAVVTVLDVTVTGSTALNGAVYVGAGSFYAAGLIASNCRAFDSGAVIYNQASMVVVGSTFTANTANNGGAIGFTDVGLGTITGCTFIGNSAGKGGALNFPAVGTTVITQTTFTSNIASSLGGAIAIDYLATITVTGGTFTSNSAALNGGAIYHVGTSLILQSSTITQSKAASGAGIYATKAITMSGTSVTSNTATGQGGGLALVGNPSGSFTGVTLTGNVASSGAGVSCANCALSFTGGSMSNNHATAQGAALYCPSGPGSVAIDAATTVDSNVADGESTLQASCSACGCCVFAAPAVLTSDTPRCTTLPGRTCVYACAAGYSIDQPSGVTCPANGVLPSICTPIACPALTPTLGMIIDYSIKPPVTLAVANYTCAPAFAKAGNVGTRNCLGPNWLSTGFQCVSVACNALDAILNGSFVIYNNVSVRGETAYITCDAGFQLSTADNTLQCDNPNWPAAPFCTPIACEVTLVPTGALNVDRTGQSVTGNYRSFSCDPGHYISYGTADQYCIGPTWVDAATKLPAPYPECSELPCPSLGAIPEHATLVVDKLTFGGQATYTCEAGYQMTSGGPQLNCELVGGEVAWVGTVPTCEAIFCPALDSTLATDCAAPYGYQAGCNIGCAAGYVGVTIDGYQCSQNDVNGGANWTLNGADAYFTTCEACVVGFYAVALSNTEVCTACINGYTPQVAAGSKADCYCNPGYREVDPTNDPGECGPCPPGGFCRGKKFPPTAGPGYYQVVSDLVECTPKAICLGDNTCLDGHTGSLCATCIPSYYKLNGYCKPCPDYANAIVGVGIAVGVIVVAILIVSSRPGASRERLFGYASVPIGIAFVQMASSFYSFRLPWPVNTRQALDGLSFFNINIELFSPECVVSLSYLDKIRYTLLIPLFLLVLFVIIGIIWLLWIFARHRSEFRQHYRRVLSDLAAGFLNFLVLAYLTLARNAMEPFACNTLPDGRITVIRSPNTLCYDDAWWRVASLCIFSIVVYVVGIPLVLLGLYLYEQPGNSAMLNPLFSFYVAKFRPGAWYYEIVIMMRKFAIVCFAVFLDGQSVVQAVITVVLLFCMCVATIIVKPFRWSKHNMFEVVTLAGLCILIFGGVLMTFSTFTAAATADTIMIVLLAIEALAFLLVLGAELYVWIYVRYLRKKLGVKPLQNIGVARDPRGVVALGEHVLAINGEGAAVMWNVHEGGKADESYSGVDSPIRDAVAVIACDSVVVSATASGLEVWYHGLSRLASQDFPAGTAEVTHLAWASDTAVPVVTSSSASHATGPGGAREYTLAVGTTSGQLLFWRVTLRGAAAATSGTDDKTPWRSVSKAEGSSSAAGVSGGASGSASKSAIDITLKSAGSSGGLTASGSRSRVSLSRGSGSKSRASSRSRSGSVSGGRSPEAEASLSEQESTSDSETLSMSHSAAGTSSDVGTATLEFLASVDAADNEPVAALAGSQGDIFVAAAHAIQRWTINEKGQAPLMLSQWDLSGLHHHVTAMTITGARVVVGFSSGTLRVLDERTLNVVNEIHEHVAEVRCLVLCGRYVISGAADGNIKVWCAKTWTYLQTLGTLRSAVIHLHARPRDFRVTACGRDGQIAQGSIEPRWHIHLARKDCYDGINFSKCWKSRSDWEPVPLKTLDEETSYADLSAHSSSRDSEDEDGASASGDSHKARLVRAASQVQARIDRAVETLARGHADVKALRQVTAVVDDIENRNFEKVSSNK